MMSYPPPTDTPTLDDAIDYPESDGAPVADNTRQFRYIMMIQGGLDWLFRDVPDVFVAGDLFWYPVQGQRDIRCAPDTLVVFGRPKGDRSSYKQWEEDGIAPQVVFEIWSPGNRAADLREKYAFYERYGVEEYYRYDPDAGILEGWQRQDAHLQPIGDIAGWVSPRLGIRFALEQGELRLYRPDGRMFETFLEQGLRAEAAEARAERLAAQLRALGIDPDATG